LSGSREHPANAAAIALVAIGLIASAFALIYWKTSRDQDAMNAFLKATDDYELTLKVTRDYAGNGADKLARLRLSRMAYEKGDRRRPCPSRRSSSTNGAGWTPSTGRPSSSRLTASRPLTSRYRALALAETCISGAGGVLKEPCPVP
jgi:hypothetical protein